jgi:23S rRNA pseudouridine1911/1915/1917 synthase
LNSDTAFRAVFRLDRDTSGIVLIAKHELSASKLAGKIDKDYYAVVEGIITECGTIDKGIMRCGDSIIKRKTDDNGERAVTHYYPISNKDGNTLVKFKLETGRTHQIRVHMQSIGHPLIGDSLYGGDCSMINRQALHCKDIYFTHPITLKKMHISCDFPNDIKGVI